MKTVEEINVELRSRLDYFRAYADKAWSKGFESYDVYNGIVDEYKDLLEWIEEDE